MQPETGAACINGFDMRCPCLQIEWDWRRINYNGEIEDKLLEKEHWRGLIQIRQKQVTEAVQLKCILECCTTCLPGEVLVRTLSEGLKYCQPHSSICQNTVSWLIWAQLGVCMWGSPGPARKKGQRSRQL